MSDAGRRYHVREILGKGGFGTVYRAELVTEGGFSKVVALKVLHARLESKSGELARLKDEARMLGLVRHRALVSVDALIRLDGRWTVVMEYLPGASAQEIVGREGKFPPAVALHVVAEVASALQAVWEAEVDGKPLRLLHRDIKPSNLQLTDGGEVKVLDFGVARAEFEGREAATGRIVYGSPHYLSPERLELVDTPAGDVFALGITLAELLTAQAADPVVARPSAHAERVGKLILGSEHATDDPQVGQLVADMLAYEPGDRPTALQVEERCRALLRRHREPETRAWARYTLPKVIAMRDRSTGELSGRALTEGLNTGEVPVDLRAMAPTDRTWEPEEPRQPPPPPPPAVDAPPPPPTPPATPMPPPPASSPRNPLAQVLTSLLLSFGALGAGAFGLIGVAVLLMALSCGLAAPWVSRETCKDTMDDIDQKITSSPKSPWKKQAQDLTVKLHAGCQAGRVGLWGAVGLEQVVDDGLLDRTWDESDQRIYERRAAPYLKGAPGGGG